MRFTKLFMIVITVSIISAACSFVDTTDSDGQGSIVLSFATFTTRSLNPAIDMTPAGYRVTGTGPSGETIDTTTSLTSLEIPGLTIGDWSIAVYATNSSGTVIGQGATTVTVHTGLVSSANVEVIPTDGTGDLDVTVNWTTADVDTPSVTGSLVPPSGTELPLSFTIGSGTANCLSTALAAGYYTMITTLNDNGILVAGAVETVRIVTGETTAGTYDFSNINHPGGTISVNITTAMAEPLIASIAGGVTEITQGTDMTLTASVADYTDNVVYAWYVNGASQATGNTFTIGSLLDPGYYRVDVTAFSADGTRAGSTSHVFTVISG